ncbi:MAG: hypothetical protein B5M51_06375, partial [Anaerolinea sp. 4484_236]
MSENLYVECLDCGYQEDYCPNEFYCPKCNGKWRIARYGENPALGKKLLERIQHRPFDLWRYIELLPIKERPDISMSEGGTPLHHAKDLGMMLGLKNLYIKDERQNPTNSFKDRQAVITMSALQKELPSLVPVEKMREVAIYGTQVIKVTASYDQTKAVAAQFAKQQTGSLYLEKGTQSVPTLEAMKTVGFEIAEQLAEKLPKEGAATPWRTPDWYFQALSGGVGAVGVMKGYRELRRMGLVDSVPKIAG